MTKPASEMVRLRENVAAVNRSYLGKEHVEALGAHLLRDVCNNQRLAHQDGRANSSMAASGDGAIHVAVKDSNGSVVALVDQAEDLLAGLVVRPVVGAFMGAVLALATTAIAGLDHTKPPPISQHVSQHLMKESNQHSAALDVNLANANSILGLLGTGVLDEGVLGAVGFVSVVLADTGDNGACCSQRIFGYQWKAASTEGKTLSTGGGHSYRTDEILRRELAQSCLGSSR